MLDKFCRSDLGPVRRRLKGTVSCFLLHHFWLYGCLPVFSGISAQRLIGAMSIGVSWELLRDDLEQSHSPDFLRSPSQVRLELVFPEIMLSSFALRRIDKTWYQ